jgi:SPP1 gp7 family putative phage head morphogenesis protein
MAPSIFTPFKEAEDFLRQKVQIGTKSYTDVSQAMNARAFVSAGVAKSAILEDLHRAVVKAVEGGMTRQQFRKEFDQILAGRGWPFNARDSKGYRDWRAGVIYDTNLRMAYAAGHWKQMQETADSRPYLEYSAELDGKTRPLHREWHGTILPIDHPWWKTHYPPNGWNCRCKVISRSAADLKRLGKAVSVAPPSRMVDATVNIDGRPTTIQVPEGIDVGFDYNVGQAAWGGKKQENEFALRQPEDWQVLTRFGQAKATPSDPGPLPAPVKPAAKLAPAFERTADVSTAFLDRVRAVLGGSERIFQDATGERVLVTEGIAKHYAARYARGRRDGRERFLTFLPETLEKPQEIWMGFEVNQRGLVRLRRRYLRVIEVELDGVPVLLTAVIDTRGAQMTAITFFRADDEAYLSNRVRTGIRVFDGRS